ncbi:hypothetical protein [Amycolatopsis cihanbeyliensis]|uniref:Uncharacterized protein n=1 Tax=Amycolatopsis cihanbeyliensis TaxID=1128664 RepID=A0A542DQQ6_AMYCI|nr:hypothetical protein [Amycolatopsis cihanbeyliensis]TQJ05433.1 hypothetical protein FB471_5263 [Amycolatopsis cihanbeyliensis]
MRRRHRPPREFASLRADRADVAGWDRLAREARTCWHCKATYPTAEHATRCEEFHEAQDDAAREAARGGRASGARR